MGSIAGLVKSCATDYIDNIKKIIFGQRHRAASCLGYFYSAQCLLGQGESCSRDIGFEKELVASADGRYTVVFDGCIYGGKKIKDGLNYSFRGNSDAEIVLALYLLHGVNFVNYLPGVFSLAVWDKNEEVLLIAKDRVGERPLYYASLKGGGFLFASEVQSIVSSGLIDLALSKESIAHFLSKLYVHPSSSIYKNIYSLPAGHIGIYQSGSLKIERYWKPNLAVSNTSYEDSIAQLKWLFAESIKSQLEVDDSAAVFLSGGLDSSSIAAYAKMEKPNIKALSFRFTSGFDEGAYVQDVARMHDINLIQISEIENDNLEELFLGSVKCYGEPFADSSSIPTMLICKEAIKHSRVVLGGDGADELFGGYRVACYMERMKAKNILSAVAERLIFGALNRAMRREEFLFRSFSAKFKLENIPMAKAIDELNSIFKDDELAILGLHRNEPLWGVGLGEMTDVMALDVNNYMPGNTFVKIDRAAMAVGLEVRQPFLSKELIEFAFGLPAEFKISKMKDKIIMRDAFKSVLPVSVQQRTKQGFGSPVEKWLGHSSMQELKRFAFSNESKIYDVLDKEFVLSNSSGKDMKEWALLNLGVWMNLNI